MSWELKRRPEVREEKEREPKSDYFEVQTLISEVRDGIISEVIDVENTPERFIDKGGAGAVYDFSLGTCIKILEDREGSEAAAFMDLGNPVELEAGFLRSLSGFEVAGVRVPEVYAFWRDEDKQHKSVILMEKLDAVNLQFILNGTEPLPETCDPEVFLDALLEFMQDMHEEKGILHDDMAARNIMVDRKTGLPRVIDFGRAKVLSRMSSELQERKKHEELMVIDEEIGSALLALTNVKE